MSSEHAHRFTLDPAVTFLNHGSFGACPTEVQWRQSALRERMEREPVRFFLRDLPDLMNAARAELARFVGAQARDLVFVRNPTYAVNSVLRSLPFEPGDEIIITSHGYNACNNAARFVADRAGARVVRAEIPFPIDAPDRVVDAVTAAVTDRTRLLLIDHVTSPTGLVLPVAPIVSALAERGVDTLVDGAHGPGMLPLDLDALGAAYYAGHGHKWLCAPKGAAFLHVRADRAERVRPLAISHGANAAPSERPRLHVEFDWTGTDDPTPWLCLPDAIRCVGAMLPGGWDAVRARNREMLLAGRDAVCAALDVAPPAPDAMVGFLAAVPLPDAPDGSGAPTSALYTDPLQDALAKRFGIQVPIVPFPAPPARLVRLSCHLHNAPGDYEKLAAALPEVL